MNISRMKNMNLLQKYQSNPSWTETIPVMPLYYSRKTHYQDLDLRAVLQKEPELTLDVRMVPNWEDGVNPTGFAEVNVLPVGMFWDQSKLHRQVSDIPSTLEGVCDRMVEYHKNYFRKTWNNQDFHIILSSGGRDSRIVAWILKQLQDEEHMDLGEFKFICQGSEAKCFLDGMREMGWAKDTYEVYKLDHLLEPDYYDFWHLEDNCNGFVGPQLFPTRLDGIDPAKTCLVTSSFSSGFHNIPEISLFHFAIYYYVHTLCSSVIRFKDMLINTLGYDYVNFHTHLPAKYFLKTVGGDLIRDTILKRLGNTASLYHNHSYNFDFSRETYTRINADYQRSQLVRAFPQSEEVRTVHIDTTNVFDWKARQLRLYGLATVVEGMNLDNITLHVQDPRQFVNFHNTYWQTEIDHQKLDEAFYAWYALDHEIPRDWQIKRAKIPQIITQYEAKKIR